MSSNFSLPPNLEAQVYLASIIASSDDAIVSKDLNGNISSWNAAAERIFGYAAEEIVGKHISILIPPDLLNEEDYILGEIKQGNSVRNFETTRRRKDGRMIDISVTVSPIRNNQGEIIGASKIARDTTQLKHAERLSAHHGAIVESSDDAIISKDLNGTITSWNQSAERIFGYNASEVIGRHITLLIPQDRIMEESEILSTLRTGKRIDHFETVRRHKDGHLIPVSLTVSPIKDKKGNIIGASKISRDISDRIAVEKQLLESSRKKDEFLANMSHELRTPMNAVIGLSNLLSAMDGLPPQSKKFIETLKISADNLMNLINDLLDFSKIEADAFEIESVEFSLPEQIEKLISVINVKAREKNLSLHVHFDPTLKRQFIGDPLRLHQVLSNLLSNAVKFTEKGSIDVEIVGERQEGSNIIDMSFRIIDTGIGISADKLDMVFDKFSQADSSITRRFGGSGLGLAISKSIVEKMGGSISVQSETGIGSTFTVTLPMEMTDKESNIESFTANAMTGLVFENWNVLLVEDYEPNIMVAGAMLEQFGYKYDVARNGFEALRKFTHGHFDVILMDVQMHDLDGLEATRRIRKIEVEKGLSRTPIVAMTAHVREQDKNMCLAAGMDDFIPKPFHPAELAQKIGRYMPKETEGTELKAVKRLEEKNS